MLHRLKIKQDESDYVFKQTFLEKRTFEKFNFLNKRYKKLVNPRQITLKRNVKHPFLFVLLAYLSFYILMLGLYVKKIVANNQQQQENNVIGRYQSTFDFIFLRTMFKLLVYQNN